MDPLALREAQIFERVSRLLVEALGIEPKLVTPQATIMDDLNAESIDLLDLRFRIERAFGIRITAEDLAAAFQGATNASQFRTLFTVASLCKYIGSRLEPDGA